MTNESTTRDPHLEEREQEILDTALLEADQLLARSLQDDLQRRRRRVGLWILALGGVVMCAVILALLMGWFTLGGIQPAEAAAPSREARQQAEALSAEGWQLWQKRQLADAAEKFEESVKLDSTNANAWNGLGWALFNGGQGDRALEAFEKCVMLVPKHPAGLNGLGQVYFSQGKLKEAERYLKKAAPQAPAAWWGLTKVYLLTDRYKQAVPWAEKIVAGSPEDPWAKQMLADAKAGKLSDELRAMISPILAEAAESAPEEEHVEQIAKVLEKFRQAVIGYDLSFDQVLADQLADYDQQRTDFFPTADAWPDMLGHIARDPEKYEQLPADFAEIDSTREGGLYTTEPLSKPLRVGDNYKTLVLLDGIAKGGAVLIDTYASVVCQGDMAGVINSQSYSTTMITGDASGRMRNASYGHWVIGGKLSGTIEAESSGTLRVLGGFDGEIKLKNRFKVYLAGETNESALERISGEGTVYLEKSDLGAGVHRRGKLIFLVGEPSEWESLHKQLEENSAKR